MHPRMQVNEFSPFAVHILSESYLVASCIESLILTCIMDYKTVEATSNPNIYKRQFIIALAVNNFGVLHFPFQTKCI